MTNRLPEEGDLVVHHDIENGRSVYVVHTIPGLGRSVMRTREEAIAHAVTFAKYDRVRAWLMDSADRFVALEGD